MIKRKSLLVVIIMLFLCFVSSCGKQNDEPKGIKVTYVLNGGVFQNCTLPIKQYYQYDEDDKKLIYSPEALVNDDTIVNPGYTLEGWYTEAEFINKWNFETDTITDSGITLYAKWKKNIVYTYNVCYFDENNNKVVINSYNVSEGEEFNDKRNFADKRDGYTPFRYMDVNRNDWDFSFKHPGGNESLAIDVYVDYIEGEFALVSTKDEFIEAVEDQENIYLLNDIDLENAEIDFGDYVNMTFEGRGFKVSNFVVHKKLLYAQDTEANHLDENSYAAYISLFGKMENSRISNVSFENVEIKISVRPRRASTIFVSPLAISVKTSTVENINISSKLTIVELPEAFDEENLIIFQQEYISINDNSVLNNNLVEISKGE